jgi:inner membrane protein involved in colicin E2 resistance
MSRLIKIKCDDIDIWMEVEEEINYERGLQKVSVSETMEKVACSFENISETFKNKIDKDLAPDKIELEFGLKVSGEGNIYVVKSAAEASLKITAEWKIK